jgi:hypothetical protein
MDALIDGSGAYDAGGADGRLLTKYVREKNYRATALFIEKSKLKG